MSRLLSCSFRWVTIALFVAALSACGFKLRGDVQLPAELSVIRVQANDAFSPLQRNLEQALVRTGARLAQGNEDAAVLLISKNQLSRWPLTVGSAGRVQEYSMRYNVEMQLRDSTGKPVMPRQEIQLERSYQFESTRAQGTPGEEEVVREELEREMVQTILRRIDATLTEQ